ncbi:hypothetical protein R2F61_04325 [Mollicutes bacterium LVI A0078]|nr:hypothetical protein RZE84_04345 [Mollicutes bacterium LVI A0075]WOO91776.1 hypothetical protein R2F61_04325 [Mollicutes bacterium LVI A0078]
MNIIFKLLASIGALMLLYTGVSGGVETLFDYGFIAMLHYLFNPFLFGSFWAIFTGIQDLLLVVGLIGMLVTKSEKVTQEQTLEFED